MSPDIHELLVPNKENQQTTTTLSSNEAICLRMLSHLDDEDDLASAAMIDKSCYSTYKRNEAALLKTVVKAMKRRTLSVATQETPHTSRMALNPQAS